MREEYSPQRRRQGDDGGESSLQRKAGRECEGRSHRRGHLRGEPSCSRGWTGVRWRGAASSAVTCEGGAVRGAKQPGDVRGESGQQRRHMRGKLSPQPTAHSPQPRKRGGKCEGNRSLQRVTDGREPMVPSSAGKRIACRCERGLRSGSPWPSGSGLVRRNKKGAGARSSGTLLCRTVQSNPASHRAPAWAAGLTAGRNPSASRSRTWTSRRTGPTPGAAGRPSW